MIVRGILTQFSWTNPQKLKFVESCPEVEGDDPFVIFSFLSLRGIFCDAMTMIHIAITWGRTSCLVFLTVYLHCKSVLGTSSLWGVTAWQYPLVSSTQWLRQLLMLIFQDRLLIQENYPSDSTSYPINP